MMRFAGEPGFSCNRLLAALDDKARFRALKEIVVAH
jgi:hypothetical protein